MKYTRWAIRIVVPEERRTVPGAATEFWHCQGLPKDPTDFGMALMYPSKEAAENIIKKGRGYTCWGVPVKVECEITLQS